MSPIIEGNGLVVEGWLGRVSTILHLHTPCVHTHLKAPEFFLLSFTFLCSSLVNASLHWVRVRQNIAMLSALTACGEGCSWVEALQCLVEESSAEDLSFSCCERGFRKTCELASKMRRLVARVPSQRYSVELFYWYTLEAFRFSPARCDVPSPPLLVRDSSWRN